MDKSSYRNPTMVWRAPSRQVNPDKPHFNSFNRTHDNATGAAAPGTGYVKQPWKPRNEDGAAAGSATGSYQPRPAWKQPGERAERNSSGGDYSQGNASRGRSDSQENTAAPKAAGGWQRGVNPTAASAAAASAPAAGMSSATAAVQAAMGLKPAAKGAVAPPIPAAAAAPVGNAWTRKARVI